jgi:Zn-dependent peptidase ImmA (M78 family)
MRNRAFAAKLLAPAQALRALVVKRTVVSFEGVEDLAGYFRVSPLVIEHQLQNHRIATVEPDFGGDSQSG